MEEAERRVLNQFRARLASEIMVTESFLRALSASGVLDQRHVLDIKSASSPDARVGRLVDVLMRGGHRALPGLLELLTSTNPWLAEKMREALQEEKRQETKLKLQASVNEAGSIRYDPQHPSPVDNDIRQRVSRFLASNLERLTEAQRRNLERWLCQELMTERRRQRPGQGEHQGEQQGEAGKGVGDHHASKTAKALVRVEARATQTDIHSQDLDSLFDQVVATVHGSLGRVPDATFHSFQTRIQELVRRVRDLENFFLDCLRQFQEAGHVGRNLQELITAALATEQALREALLEERKRAEQLQDRSQAMATQVRRMEQEMEKLYLRQATVYRPRRPDYRQQRQKTTVTRQPLVQTARTGSPRHARAEPARPSMGITGNSVEAKRLSPQERPPTSFQVQRARSTSGDHGNASTPRLHQAGSDSSRPGLDRQVSSKSRRTRFS